MFSCSQGLPKLAIMGCSSMRLSEAFRNWHQTVCKPRSQRRFFQILPRREIQFGCPAFAGINPLRAQSLPSALSWSRMAVRKAKVAFHRSSGCPGEFSWQMAIRNGQICPFQFPFCSPFSNSVHLISTSVCD